MNIKIKMLSICLVVAGFALFSGIALAAPDSDFSQTINAGTLDADIKNASRVTVASPSVAMTAAGFSFDCQSGGSASTGTFGTNGERVYVSNGDAADAGWDLTIAATGGATDTWDNGGATESFDFNDAGTSGCTDDGTTADSDSFAGQLTLNPAAGTITTDCGTCSATNVSKGSSDSFDEGDIDDITLLAASSGSDDVWRGYLTGVGVSQTIPAEQPADTYTLNLTLTAVSN